MNDNLEQAKKKTIIDNCGAPAQRLFDKGHSYLKGETITKLYNSSPERQRYEINQVLSGRRPFSSKTDVFDTVRCGEVTSRLARAAGWLNLAASQTPHALGTGIFADDDVSKVIAAVSCLNDNCGQLWSLIRSGGRQADPVRPRSYRPVINDERIWSDDELMGADLKTVRGNLNCATSVVAKCVRDLAQVDLPRTREQVHAASVRLYGMRRNLWRMETALAVATPNRKKQIATHSRPDVDALVSVWLVQRFLFAEDVEVVFVPYDQNWFHHPSVDCVVDMGGMHDARWNLFDHKTPSRPDPHATCAARLVWDHLVARGLRNVEGLGELVRTVHDGDSSRLRAGSLAYRASKTSGVHACFDRVKSTSSNAHDQYRAVSGWLDANWLPDARPV